MHALKRLGEMLNSAFTPSYRMPSDARMGPTEEDKRRAREHYAFEDVRDGTMLGAPPWAEEKDPRDANWTADRGDWMETASYRKFYILDPQPEDVDIEDIAQSLSHIARFNGHYKPEINFYSVAEHCVLMAQIAQDKYGPAAGLEALLHDAAEAYIGDMVRPIKNSILGFKEIEQGVESAVRQHFGLLPYKPNWIKEMDRQMLVSERYFIKGQSDLNWANEDEALLPVTFRCWSPNRARACFLSEYHILTNRREQETSL